MNKIHKWKILFIKDDQSEFNLQSPSWKTLYEVVDIVTGREEALKFFHSNSYDFVISDLTVKPEEVAFLKQIQDIRPEQIFFAMVSPKDSDKLYGIADLGINAFELSPEQFELAMEQIAVFDPSEQQ